MKLRSLGVPSLLSAVLISGCSCPGGNGDVDIVAPTINVDVCADPADVRNVDGEFIGGSRDCTLDFETQDISTRIEREITIWNTSDVQLAGRLEEDGPQRDVPMEIFLTEGSDPSFQIELAPEFVSSGNLSKVVVSYRPLLESPVEARLVIRSNARNVPEGEDLIIELKGEGVDNGVPVIEVDPIECDFGRVAKDGVKECDVTITNSGGRDLVFEDVVDFATENAAGEALPMVPAESGGDVFGFFGRAPERNDIIPAAPEENTRVVKVRFSPDAFGDFRSEMLIKSNDPSNTELIVPVYGLGVDPPLCSASILSVNGIPGESSIEPLDDVVLTADGSTPPPSGGTIAEYRWEIISKPPTSTATLGTANGLTTGFVFDGNVAGVDVAGEYTVRATVLDDLGTENVNACDIQFDAIPTDSFLVEMSWDTSTNDIDLHLMKQDSLGRYCVSSFLDGLDVAEQCTGEFESCYYSNCKVTNANGGLDGWDGSAGVTDGDPTLDKDDLSGWGPENININEATAGNYLVGVDYFSGSGVVGITVRIYIYGQLAGEFYRELNSSGDWWELGVLEWPVFGEGQPCLEDFSTEGSECDGTGGGGGGDDADAGPGDDADGGETDDGETDDGETDDGDDSDSDGN